MVFEDVFIKYNPFPNGWFMTLFTILPTVYVILLQIWDLRLLGPVLKTGKLWALMSNAVAQGQLIQLAGVPRNCTDVEDCCKKLWNGMEQGSAAVLDRNFVWPDFIQMIRCCIVVWQRSNIRSSTQLRLDVVLIECYWGVLASFAKNETQPWV